MAALGTPLAKRVIGEVVVKVLTAGSTIVAFTLALASGPSAAAQTAAMQAPATPSAAPSQTPSAGAAEQPAQAVFRSGASFVAVNVTVTDGTRFVTGLASDDFAVYEDGVQQQVQFFESASVPVDLIILLDTSASMTDKMSVVHEAATGFLKALRTGDRGAIVAFNDGVDVLQDLTSDREALEGAIRRTHARGSTALHNALYVSMNQFGRSPHRAGEVRRQTIAVLSDGEDTSSLLPFDDVLAMARKSGINIYTIGLQNQYASARAESGRRYFSQSDYSMKSLAQETGGLAFFPQAVHELKGIYASIAEDLSNQYSLGYAPTNGRPDGRFRRIIVRVSSHPEFRPRARMGYTADSNRTVASTLDRR